MSQSDPWVETVKEIAGAVERAASSQNFTNLSSQIKDSITTALKQSGVEVPERGSARSGGEAKAASQRNTAGSNRNPSSGINRTIQVQGVRSYVDKAPAASPWFQKRVSKNMGLGSLIGGIIGLLFTGIPSLVYLILALVVAPTFFVGVGIFGGLTALFTWLTSRGASLQGLVNRFYTYGGIAGNREYVTIDELERQSGRKRSRILSDIKKFRLRNMLSLAVIDRDESTLMLTDKAYREYRTLTDQRTAAEKELAAQQREKIELEKSDLPEDVKDLLAEGQAYLLRVRNYNDEIPDTEAMSGKLYELENIMKRIFAQVRKDPASAKELRKFMNYYLPTTDKLLSSYVEITKQGATGANLSSAKSEIESAMDTINEAFTHLLDKLFESTAWDVSSDISVMKTMMEQDGLTRSSPKKEAEQEKILV